MRKADRRTLFRRTLHHPCKKRDGSHLVKSDERVEEKWTHLRDA